MLNLEALRELFRHMEWADASVWRAVLTHQRSSPDSRLRDLLLHLHGVQRGFLSVWTSQPPDFPAADAFPDLASLQQWASAYYPRLAAYLRDVNEASLVRPVEMPWVREFEQQTGRRFETPTLAETMFQVSSHSTYHRGQANARLREIGGEPPNVDYIAWIWFGRPAPEWTRGA